MTHKHTPGPWTPMGKPIVGFMEVKAQPSPAFRGFTKAICHMDGIETDTKEREANARLIAAAPTMLETLHYADAEFARLGLPEDCSPRLEVRREIAKATGKTQ